MVETDFLGSGVKKPGSRLNTCLNLVLYEAAQPGHNNAVVLGQEVFDMLYEDFHHLLHVDYCFQILVDFFLGKVEVLKVIGQIAVVGGHIDESVA
jgi:hypothetical protein